ncbi:hypothetical protein HK097_009525, partial [Rhizophlyctis rosea]
MEITRFEDDEIRRLSSNGVVAVCAFQCVECVDTFADRDAATEHLLEKHRAYIDVLASYQDNELGAGPNFVHGRDRLQYSCDKCGESFATYDLQLLHHKRESHHMSGTYWWELDAPSSPPAPSSPAHQTTNEVTSPSSDGSSDWPPRKVLPRPHPFHEYDDAAGAVRVMTDVLIKLVGSTKSEYNSSDYISWWEPAACPGHSVLICDFPTAWTENDYTIRDFFPEIGEAVKVSFKPVDEMASDMCFVSFSTAEAAKKAIEWDRKFEFVEGKSMRIMDACLARRIIGPYEKKAALAEELLWRYQEYTTRWPVIAERGGRRRSEKRTNSSRPRNESALPPTLTNSANASVNAGDNINEGIVKASASPAGDHVQTPNAKPLPSRKRLGDPSLADTADTQFLSRKRAMLGGEVGTRAASDDRDFKTTVNSTFVTPRIGTGANHTEPGRFEGETTMRDGVRDQRLSPEMASGREGLPEAERREGGIMDVVPLGGDVFGG